MVYDPIRDCEVPSPAASIHNSSPWADTPHTDPRSTPTSGYPPHFHHDRRSPVPAPLHRSVSGGLRGLLNDEGGDTRIASGRDSLSSIGPEDSGHLPPRGRINNLLNESAPPLSQSSSQSSMGHSAYSQQSHQSPISKPYSLLDHDGFLAPVTPASAYPRASRSPYSLNSPSGYPHQPLPGLDSGPLRSPYPSIHDSMPLRSPSISVSPRQYYQSLPPAHPQSRPGSSSSAGGFAFNTPSVPHESPSLYQRQMSLEYSSRPRSGSRTTGPSSRRPSNSLPPPRSPSPPSGIPYEPHNRTSSSFLLNHPITQDELESLKVIGQSNNPLRRKAPRPPPSWSGPSPSPGMRRSSGPQESDASYFPRDSPGPSASKKRKTSDNYGRNQDALGGRNGSEASRRRVDKAKYMGNVALVADHCEARSSSIRLRDKMTEADTAR